MTRRRWTHRRPTAAAVAAVMIIVYFLLPIDALGPHRAGVSWTVLVATLTAVAALLLRQIRNVVTERPGTRPGIFIALLILLTVLVFAAAYHALAQHPGEFNSLSTRLDALYFTVVTLATVGYGDIVPTGQTARGLTLVQILYSFVFLTAAASAMSQRLHKQLLRRPQREGGAADETLPDGPEGDPGDGPGDDPGEAAGGNGGR
ncbi:potassium channel family protein [Streptomyces sp. NPDC093225]|uniref:potassium channel family protein n=1 Tax=Streptomyces sp. NPDC093225 TaxID=3366034 RepID=UPI0037FDAF12